MLPQPYHMHAMPTPRRRCGRRGPAAVAAVVEAAVGVEVGTEVAAESAIGVDAGIEVATESAVGVDAGIEVAAETAADAEALNASASRRNASQRGRSASRQATRPALALQHLAGGGAVSGPQRVAAPEFERVDAAGDRQLVDQGLVRDRGLGHAEAAEGARRRRMREDRARLRTHVRHAVRTHAVHRDPPGHGGAPGGVGPGVEISVELVSEQAPAGVGHRAGTNARRVPLGGGGHRLGARVGVAHRLVQQPRRQRHQGLDGLVEFAAETAPAGGGADAHLPGRDAEHVRHLVRSM